uniref:Gag-Pol polyprotein n=1 Tax=Tanacetum cinerariifolium TaxID=118510 RepID=A0A6L2KST3_TANCI|nr:hypothetical protein [Tanacetum cinerariifolium]
MIFEDPPVDTSQTMSKKDLNNFFGLLYDEYYEGRNPNVSTFDNSDAPDTLGDTSSKIIIVDVDEAPQLDGNEFINPFSTPSSDEAESSSRKLDPLKMHTFYQPLPYEHQWTKAHPLEQILKDPSKAVMTRSKLFTNADMCVYALTVSLVEPSNIKEAMVDHG